MLVNMLVEFVKNFKKVCDEEGIDILNEFWGLENTKGKAWYRYDS